MTAAIDSVSGLTTPQELAKLAGIAPSTVSAWRNQGTQPNAEQVRKVSQALRRSYVECAVAAGLINWQDLEDWGLEIPKHRTPLGEFSDSEIMQEAQRRLQAHINSTGDQSE